MTEEDTDDATEEPEIQKIEVPITTEVMQSLSDQMDSTGKGSLDMRMGVALVDNPETGEPLGELLVGMSGGLWFESAADDGRRVRFGLNELARASLAALNDAEPFDD